MRVRGLTLPSEFVSCVQRGALRPKRGSRPLHLDRDAFGYPWEAELSEIYETAAEIEHESDLLSKHFAPDIGDVPEMFSGEPGFIPYITDFSRILAFAIAGDGAPYCFDYRERMDRPSIIWWDDVYWRRVAPDFTTFIGLFGVK